MKHKHYDLIIAWANGAKIQYLGWDVEAGEMNRLFGKKLETRVWIDCDTTPNWYTDFEYRIKPEPKPDTTLATIHGVGCWVIGGNWRVYVQEKPNTAQIKNTRMLLGWEWEDAV
jgi:hypothetical protein